MTDATDCREFWDADACGLPAGCISLQVVGDMALKEEIAAAIEGILEKRKTPPVPAAPAEPLITEEELAEWERVCGAALETTTGKEIIYRRYDHGGGRAWSEDGSEQGDRDLLIDVYDEANRDFYFMARTAMPRLLAAVRAKGGAK